MILSELNQCSTVNQLSPKGGADITIENTHISVLH